MTDQRADTPLIGGVTLLERAINYTLGSLHSVTDQAMSHPTPCRDWDLRALLGHMNDSLVALYEAVDARHVDVRTSAGDPGADPVAAVQDRACRLLGASVNVEGPDVTSIGDCPVTASIVTTTGSVEVAVHGWDVAQACGQPRAIPSPLAEELLQLSPLFVTDADRHVRFAYPVNVSPLATPSERLVAFLGRAP